MQSIKAGVLILCCAWLCIHYCLAAFICLGLGVSIVVADYFYFEQMQSFFDFSPDFELDKFNNGKIST